MRFPILFTVLGLTLAGCWAPAIQDGASSADLEVLDVVLNDLLRQGVETYPGGGKTLYVSRDSLGENDFYLSDAQLGSDLQDYRIPDGVAASLRKRNQSVTTIWGDGLASRFAKIGEFEQISDRNFHPEDYPDCKLIATFWLPGYSANGQYAMVRFAISPTPHGSTGTYLLKRNGGTWSIEWFEESYYF